MSHLTLDAIEAYVMGDGWVRPDAEAHVEECVACRRALAEEARFEMDLYRAFNPRVVRARASA